MHTHVTQNPSKKNARIQRQQQRNKRQLPSPGVVSPGHPPSLSLPHLLDVALREVVDLLPERRHARQRPRAGLPQLDEQRVLPSASSASRFRTTCTAQATRSKPTSSETNPTRPLGGGGGSESGPKHPQPAASDTHTRTHAHSPPPPAAGAAAAIGSHMHFPPTTSSPAGIRPDLRRRWLPPHTWHLGAICAGKEKEKRGGSRRRGEGILSSRPPKATSVSCVASPPPTPLSQRDCVHERAAVPCVCCVSKGCKRERERERGEGVCQFRPPRVGHHDRAVAAPQR